MMERYLILLCCLLALSCGKKLMEEPEDLIPAAKMSEILYDMALLDAIDQSLAEVAVQSIRLHWDCHHGNILWTEQGPHFVDLDDCCMGPAIQDLWMLLSGQSDEMRTQLQDLLEGYETFFDFDHASVILIEALRTLRLMHYSAWIARRWNDPAFPRAFPWFDSPRYWEEHILTLREQAAAMDEPLVL